MRSIPQNRVSALLACVLLAFGIGARHAIRNIPDVLVKDRTLLGSKQQILVGRNKHVLTKNLAEELPLFFEPNQGQAGKQFQFLRRGHGYQAFLSKDSVELRLADRLVRLKWIGSDVHGQPRGLDRLTGAVNYFYGNDPARWHTSIPTYARVQYDDLYPGIDLTYHNRQRLAGI